MLRLLVAGVVGALGGALATVLGLVYWDGVEVLIGVAASVIGWAFLAAFRDARARGDRW